MRSLQSAASALEAALQDLLSIFHAERSTPEVVVSLQARCVLLTTQLVEATASSTPGELEDAAPALRRAQRLNVIAREVVEQQREAAGTLITSAQRARRALGSDAPVADGTSCDVQA
jgi:hypothetical protein